MLSSPLHLKHNADVHNFELSGNNAMHLVMLKFEVDNKEKGLISIKGKKENFKITSFRAIQWELVRACKKSHFISHSTTVSSIGFILNLELTE